MSAQACPAGCWRLLGRVLAAAPARLSSELHGGARLEDKHEVATISTVIAICCSCCINFEHNDDAVSTGVLAPTQPLSQ
eukprot:SAG22_NODE_150_length_17426_cov_8.082588_13_plen_79_part_00